jgi:hypothetical protein
MCLFLGKKRDENKVIAACRLLKTFELPKKMSFL